MGTKVQCENYLPVNYLTRDLSEDSSSHFSQYYDDKTLSAHLYDGCMLTPVNGYPVYDKEMLKRTMLEHEAVFRNQVWELHRVYRIQKDLMDELKNQDLHSVPVQKETSECHIYSSQMSSETTQKMWQVPHLTAANTSYNMAAVADNDDTKPSLNLIQCNEMARKVGGSVEVRNVLDSKLKNHPKRMLDLQLPADVYIDSEDSERTIDDDIPGTSLMPMDHLSSIYDVEHERDVKLTLGINEDPSWSNGSKKFYRHQQNGQSVNGLAGLNMPLDGGVRTLRGEVQSHQMPYRSNRSFRPGDLFTEKHRDEEACSNFDSSVKEEAIWEWPPINYEDDLSTEKYPPLARRPRRPKLKLKRAHKTAPHPSDEQIRSDKSPTLAIGAYANSSQLVETGLSLVTTTEVPNPYSITALTESTSFMSPLPLVSRRKPAISYAPIAVQALPCFSQAEIMKYKSRKLRKSVTDLIVPQDKMQTDGNIRQAPRFETESPSYQTGVPRHPCSNSGYSKVKIGHDSIAYEDYEGKSPMDVSFSKSILNAGQGARKHQQSSEMPSSLITRPPCVGSGMDICFSQSLNQSLKDSSCLLEKKRKKRRNGAPIEGTKNKVNNAAVVDADVVTGLGCQSQTNLDTLGITYKGEADAQTGKVVCEITMEDLIPIEETLDNMAAENLVAISLALGHPSAAASCDSLHWFAKLILSGGACAETANIDDFESMTLELDEVKSDEYRVWIRNQGTGNEHNASLLLGKMRRGQLRKRRQKKDFQKDILPGLVSLSRHQVAEDLQAFEIMMRAGDSTWQAGTARRGTGRKGSSSRGRGRRLHSTCSTLVITDVDDALRDPPPVIPLVPTEADVNVIDACSNPLEAGSNNVESHTPLVTPLAAIDTEVEVNDVCPNPLIKPLVPTEMYVDFTVNIPGVSDVCSNPPPVNLLAPTESGINDYSSDIPPIIPFTPTTATTEVVRKANYSEEVSARPKTTDRQIRAFFLKAGRQGKGKSKGKDKSMFLKERPVEMVAISDICSNPPHDMVPTEAKVDMNITDVSDVHPDPPPVKPLVPMDAGVDVDYVCSNPPPVKPLVSAEADTDIVDRWIAGWGRTTRRGRKPRVKSGNSSLLLFTNHETF